MEAFYSLVKKSTTSDNHLVFNSAFKTDRSTMSTMEDKFSDQNHDYHESSAVAYDTEVYVEEEEPVLVHHESSSLPTPTL